MCSEETTAPEIKAPFNTYNVGFPMEHIVIDVLGPLPTTEVGNKYILIIADYFTKWVEAHPIANQEAPTVAEVLAHEFISHFGVPLLIHTDQGVPGCIYPRGDITLSVLP